MNKIFLQTSTEVLIISLHCFSHLSSLIISQNEVEISVVFEFLLQKVFISQEIPTGHAQKSHDLS